MGNDFQIRTKEVIIALTRKQDDHTPTHIKGGEVGESAQLHILGHTHFRGPLRNNTPNTRVSVKQARHLGKWTCVLLLLRVTLHSSSSSAAENHTDCTEHHKPTATNGLEYVFTSCCLQRTENILTGSFHPPWPVWTAALQIHQNTSHTIYEQFLSQSHNHTKLWPESTHSLDQCAIKILGSWLT